jgi:FkbM family methyltransferase
MGMLNPMAVFRRVKALFKPNPDRFLKQVTGVIHVGANSGQERNLYRRCGLRVIWIEPIPDVFQKLSANLSGYPDQRAFQYIVTDKDDSEYTFHIANNDGASSSILEMKMHHDIWPTIEYERTITLRSVTLPLFLQKERINAADYQALILDTQGAELLVLKGADPILSFRFLKIEVPDFESYEGCCQLRDIGQFLLPRGFHEYSRHKFAERPSGGSYYDVVYERTIPPHSA